MSQNCQEPGCEIKRACFNYPGEIKGKFCFKHQIVDEMEDVVHPKCEFGGCKKRPNYNFKGEKKGKYCKIHADHTKMIDISHPSCIYPECETRPCYNFEGEKKALYCVSHADLTQMVDVVNKRCIHPGCKTQPIYNYVGKITALYCKTHMDPNEMVDVKHKLCIVDGCKTRGNFNFPWETNGLYCFEHSDKEQMIDIDAQKCEYPECLTRPSFNYDGETHARFCEPHALTGMKNIKSRKCKTELCGVTTNKNTYDGYCFRCFIHLFPDKPVVKNYKTKEYNTVQFVLENFPDLSWITDKKVQNGCSSRRPDMLVDLGYQILIVEIDENQHQHQNYSLICENKRLMELSQDVGHRPIVFIRFNPDDYIMNGKIITSCWGLDKKGLCTVKKSKRSEWVLRLSVLRSHIDHWINPENKTDKTVEVIQLFYDQ